MARLRLHGPTPWRCLRSAYLRGVIWHTSRAPMALRK